MLCLETPWRNNIKMASSMPPATKQLYFVTSLPQRPFVLLKVQRFLTHWLYDETDFIAERATVVSYDCLQTSVLKFFLLQVIGLLNL